MAAHRPLASLPSPDSELSFGRGNAKSLIIWFFIDENTSALTDPAEGCRIVL